MGNYKTTQALGPRSWLAPGFWASLPARSRLWGSLPALWPRSRFAPGFGSSLPALGPRSQLAPGFGAAPGSVLALGLRSRLAPGFGASYGQKDAQHTTKVPWALFFVVLWFALHSRERAGSEAPKPGASQERCPKAYVVLSLPMSFENVRVEDLLIF